MITKSADMERILAIRLNPGDDIIEQLERAVKENAIQSALILNGLGSARAYHIHVVDDKNLPPAESFLKKEEPCDIISMCGAVIDGRIHCHITLANDRKAFGGHMHKGCTVLTFAVIFLAETPGSRFTDWDKIIDF
jgi:predicted DNA-binding protein with PD1-like motif